MSFLVGFVLGVVFAYAFAALLLWWLERQ